jgi:transglutaminase-like putative cysteine protease
VKLRRLHRRLAVLMSVAGVTAFLSGAGFDSIAAVPTLLALILALFWQASPAATVRLERILLGLSILLAGRALYHVFFLPDDVVIPMADLLLLMVGAEALKSLDALNDGRLYSLSFALLIASTAYRPSILFGVAFLAYTALSTVALMVGHIRRQVERRNLREPELPRPFLVRMAALSGVALAMSAVLFIAFPRVSRGWASRTVTEEKAIVGFGDEVSLAEHGGRIYANPEIVLRVEFPDGRPNATQQMYWRGRSYDRFDGVRWSHSPSLPLSAAAVPYALGWGGQRSVRQDIYAMPLDTHVLFGLHPIFAIRPRSRIRAFMDESGDFNYFGNVAPVYEVESFGGKPSAEQLERAPDGRAPAAEYYTQLPAMSDRIRTLADSITAGKKTRYEKVRAIESYFHTQFGYTLELPATARQATLEYFLFRRRQGHCEYFSTAMVVMLRSIGIPARNVNGFLGGDWNDFGSYLAVTQNRAHSWAEVWFPGYNWVQFDPTPAAADTGDRSATAWFWPLRFVFDGAEHRWDKWILDYDLDKQVDLFHRAAQQFSRDDSNTGSGHGANTPFGSVFRWLLALVALGLIVGGARGAFKRQRLSEASRGYLRLRRAYERAGFVNAPSTPPLTFVRGLRDAHAPGVEHAEKAVDVYVHTRFNNEVLDEYRKEELRKEVNAAKKELKKSRAKV